MEIVNLRQASTQLGFKTTTTLRRLLKLGELDAYLRSGPDLRATYLEIAPKGLPTLRKHVQAHTECRGNSPLWGVAPDSCVQPPIAVCSRRGIGLTPADESWSIEIGGAHDGRHST